MTEADQITAIEAASRAYLETLRLASGDLDERLTKLAFALDALCTAFHNTRDTEPEADVDAPRADPRPFGEQAGASFPELGFYPDVDPLGPPDQPLGQGWGLDDLIDIALDLTDVLWLIERREWRNAIWDFRFGYQNHWGHHLHDLRRYIHRLQYWG